MKTYEFKKKTLPYIPGAIRINGKFETYIFRDESSPSHLRYNVYDGKYQAETINEIMNGFDKIYEHHQMEVKYKIKDRLVSFNDVLRICNDTDWAVEKDYFYDINNHTKKYEKSALGYQQAIHDYNDFERIELCKN